MRYFAKRGVAIAFGALLSLRRNLPPRRYRIAVRQRAVGAALARLGCRGVPAHCRGAQPARVDAAGRRQYQAVAWGFMLSLLLGALFSSISAWLTPPAETDWLSEGGFVLVISIMSAIACAGIVSTLTTRDT